MDKNNIKQEAILTVSTIDINYEDYTQSANTLFHFMSKMDFLKTALKNKCLDARYCIENISYLGLKLNGEPINEIAVLQKCFCDIPLAMSAKRSKIKIQEIDLKKLSEKYIVNSERYQSHTDFYGEYGIGFSKQWAENKNIQPVQYLASCSQYTKNMSKVLQHLLNATDISDIEFEDALMRFCFIKPLHGIMNRKLEFQRKDGSIEKDIDVSVEKNFHDEKEWRFVPKIEDIHTIFPEEYPIIANKDSIFQIHMDKEYLDRRINELAKKKVSSLPFEFDDIRYLIVPSQTQKLDLINHIDSLDLSKEQKYLLCSKILTLDEIRKDI